MHFSPPVSVGPRRRGLFPLLALLIMMFATLGAAEPLPVAQLSELPRFTNPKLAPDGTRMCVITRKGTSQSLTEISFTGAPPRELAVFNGHARLSNYWWKGTDLLLLVADEKGAAEFRALDMRTGKINELEAAPHWDADLRSILPDEPDSVLLEYDPDYGRTMGGLALGRLNVHTGTLDRVKLGPIPSAVHQWIVNDKGEAVAGMGVLENKIYLIWRPGPGEEWQRRELGRADRPQLVPAAIHPDQKRVLAWEFMPSGPARMVAIDPVTMKQTEVFAPALVDPDSIESWGQDWTRPRAIRYEVERPSWHLLDPEAEKIRQSIDAALPGTVNDIVSSSVDGQIMIINAWSDRDRGSYYLLDRMHQRVLPLGRQFGGYDPKVLCASQRFEYISRDGLTLHGRLTLPKPMAGEKPPLIVLTSRWFTPNRARLEFQPLVQFLATRGYAVAQLETRGTRGYGQALVRDGDYQMDTGIPNDLADGTRWLINQGLVDGRRTALAGDRWGGVIAIQALAKNPGVFTVWLNFDTPVDLRDLEVEDLAVSTSDSHTVAAQLGGRSVGEKMLKKLAPADLIPKITVPSFHYYHGYGGSFYAAGSEIKKLLLKSSAEHAVYDNRLPTTYTVEELEAKQQEQSRDFAGHLLAFLDAHLKPSHPASAAAP